MIISFRILTEPEVQEPRKTGIQSSFYLMCRTKYFKLGWKINKNIDRFINNSEHFNPSKVKSDIVVQMASAFKYLQLRLSNLIFYHISLYKSPEGLLETSIKSRIEELICPVRTGFNIIKILLLMKKNFFYSFINNSFIKEIPLSLFNYPLQIKHFSF